MGDPDGTVIPAKAGIQKIQKLALMAGLLVLLGAGCNNAPPSKDTVQNNEIQTDSLLVVKDDRGRPYIDGVNAVCSFENAALIFPKDENWAKAADAIKEKEQQGWVMKKFCYEKGIGGGIVMERVDGGLSALLGSFSESDEPSLSFSEPLLLSRGGKYDGRWDLKILPPTDGPSVVWATTHDDDLGYGWLEQETYGYAAGGSPENTVVTVEQCAKQVNDKPITLKINLPHCKN